MVVETIKTVIAIQSFQPGKQAGLLIHPSVLIKTQTDKPAQLRPMEWQFNRW
jgi:hypothetical protein